MGGEGQGNKEEKGRKRDKNLANNFHFVIMRLKSEKTFAFENLHLFVCSFFSIFFFDQKYFDEGIHFKGKVV